MFLNRRIKFSHDPNNIQWALSQSAFGHKILRRQGWSPGYGLGAYRAADPFVPAANIKIAFKDDNLGLGARVGRQEKNSSSDAFAGLLGRLNGKDVDQLAEEKRKSGIKSLERYVLGKWGAVLFVRGGLLVQRDDFKDVGNTEMKDSQAIETETVDPEIENANERALRRPEKEVRRQRKEERRQRKKAQSLEAVESADAPTSLCQDNTSPKEERDARKARKEDRKRRKVSKKHVLDELEVAKGSGSISEITAANGAKESDESSIKSPPKNVKRKRRKEKEKEKETGSRKKPEIFQEKQKEQPSSSTENAKVSTAPESTPITPQPPVDKVQAAPIGRHVIRGRHIAQKKAAFLDDSSLKGIFMVKAR